MPSFEDELIEDIRRFEATVAEYGRNPQNNDTAEMLCIASRSVTALFQEVCVWDDRVDSNLRKQVIAVLGQAEAALTNSTFEESDSRFTYLTRIRERISAVKEFSLEHVTAAD